LEIVRRALELLRESYESGRATDGLLELCAPDIRVDATRRVFNPGVYEGEAGALRSIREICDAWEDFRQINERLIDVGDRVVVLETIGGRGRASKAHVEQKGDFDAALATLSKGAVWDRSPVGQEVIEGRDVRPAVPARQATRRRRPYQRTVRRGRSVEGGADPDGHRLSRHPRGTHSRRMARRGAGVGGVGDERRACAP
jgi:hypothetical protein